MAPTESETPMFASASERDEHFRSVVAPFTTYDFRVYDEWNNGEFMTGAKVDLIVRGVVVHTEQFTASSEFPPGDGFSAYGNGRDNYALTLALSYAWAWVEAQEAPLEERLAPFGPEFEREMAEAWA